MQQKDTNYVTIVIFMLQFLFFYATITVIYKNLLAVIFDRCFYKAKIVFLKARF